MCMACSSFSPFSIAASVVVLPLPVAPVTKTRPFFSAMIFLKTGASFRSSIVGIFVFSLRKTMAKVPLCLKTFTRKRARPSTKYEQSHEPELRRSSSRR